MKKLFALIFAAMMLLSACSPAAQQPGETIAVGDAGVIDFVTSQFKHITNGGITEDENLPYNIDAITGATMTVEGPAIVTSIPLSVRELENRSEGFFRGIYTDSKGTFAYEGMDLYYLLHNMTEGDNGIKMTDTAYKVVLKSSSRLDVAQFTLDEVIKAHNEGNPILLACGMGTTDGSVVAPFVFDAANENEHSLGYKEELDNDDGWCMILRKTVPIQNIPPSPMWPMCMSVRNSSPVSSTPLLKTRVLIPPATMTTLSLSGVLLWAGR